MLVYTAVVSGLNNFQVGMPSVFPTEGSGVNHNSYTVCGMRDVAVSPGLVINIDCSPSIQRFRYVIVQSLDSGAEILCIAEVAVYEGQYAVMYYVCHVDAAIKLHIDALLMS